MKEGDKVKINHIIMKENAPNYFKEAQNIHGDLFFLQVYTLKSQESGYWKLEESSVTLQEDELIKIEEDAS